MTVYVDNKNEFLYFFLNLYQIIAIVGEGWALIAVFLCCVFLWLFMWGFLLSIVNLVIKKKTK